MRFIVVNGTVMSGIGKGVAASSIGVLLKAGGVRVTAIKIDPYLNIDSGTMSPFEHGECYVLEDGGETDLDLGNYERFLNLTLTKKHNITTGKIYGQVISNERRGKYLGKTVQIIPHITDAIQEWIIETAKIPTDGSNLEPQVCIIELGGTVGDIESEPYIEALRQLSFKNGVVMFVNVCYVPVVGDETKTKPTQTGIRELMKHGVTPDLLIVRCERELSQDSLAKLSGMCQINQNAIIMNVDVDNIYRVPLIFHKQGLFQTISTKLGLTGEVGGFLDVWRRNADRMSDSDLPQINIGIVGKYTGLVDSYLSLTNAIKHAGIVVGCRPHLHFIEAETLQETCLKDMHGVVIPGGFGQRGVEGMIQAAKYCRENSVPLLGICLGFQVMVIDIARHLAGLTGADSTEFNPDAKHPVITIIDPAEKKMGGTMRLGSTRVILEDYSKIQRLYNGQGVIWERHRHRYEVGLEYLEALRPFISFSGWDEEEKRMEVLELKADSFYMGTQFHGEYQSRPLGSNNGGHPVFNGWMRESLKFYKNICIV